MFTFLGTNFDFSAVFVFTTVFVFVFATIFVLASFATVRILATVLVFATATDDFGAVTGLCLVVRTGVVVAAPMIVAVTAAGLAVAFLCAARIKSAMLLAPRTHFHSPLLININVPFGVWRTCWPVGAFLTASAASFGEGANLFHTTIFLIFVWCVFFNFFCC